MKNLNEASFSPKTVLILMRFTVHCGQLNDFKYPPRAPFPYVGGFLL